MASTVFINGQTLTASAWFQDVDNIAYQYLSGVAGTNTITAIGPAGLGAYAAGLKFRFIPAVTNTGATTINITGTAALGARTIFSAGVALAGGELTVGVPVEIIDDGTRFHISAGAMVPRVLPRRKPSDQSLTSQISLQNDVDLTIPIAALEEWVMDFYLDIGAALSTTGLKTGLTVPSGATMNATLDVIGGTAGNTISKRSTSSGLIADLVTGFWSSTDTVARVHAWVLNGATPGTITLQFAQSSSSLTALTMRKGSHAIATRIA